MNKEFLETIKAEDGRLFHLAYHQKRFEQTLLAFGLTHVPQLHDLLSPPEKGLYRCRVLYSCTNFTVSYHPYVKRNVHSLKLIYDDTIEYTYKYADREKLNAHFLQKEQADDILIIKNQQVTDTSIANIAFFDGERWFTPKTPLLKGTTRERLLDLHKIYEKDISVASLQQYKKVALLNAMIDFDIISEDKHKGLYC